MFFNIPTSQWSLDMIANNFADWIFQGCVERENKKGRCTKCGENILADEDALCGRCSGESIDEQEKYGAYQDSDGEWVI